MQRTIPKLNKSSMDLDFEFGLQIACLCIGEYIYKISSEYENSFTQEMKALLEKILQSGYPALLFRINFTIVILPGITHFFSSGSG